MHKHAALTLIAILTITSIATAIPPTQAITKPSTPTFTIEEITCPYDVPTTYTKDPYTGQTITHPGYHVENKTTYLKIKNQPFTPYTIKDREVNLYYQYRYQGHYADGEYWSIQPFEEYSTEKHKQSNSEYTHIALDIWHAREGDQFDIQVRVFIGSVEITDYISPGDPENRPNMTNVNHNGAKSDWVSDWSKTRVWTAGNPSVTPTPPVSSQTPPPTNTEPSNPEPQTPDQPNTENNGLFGLNRTETAIAILFIITVGIIIGAVVLLTLRKNRPHNKKDPNQWL
jgi:hypothetical protein